MNNTFINFTLPKNIDCYQYGNYIVDSFEGLKYVFLFDGIMFIFYCLLYQYILIVLFGFINQWFLTHKKINIFKIHKKYYFKKKLIADIYFFKLPDEFLKMLIELRILTIGLYILFGSWK